MAKLYNLAGMSTATTGTGTITLGSAMYGHLTFAQAGVQDGETVTYAIKDGAASEIGRGVYTSSGTTLTRTALKSTNSNSAISLSGSAEVFITPAAEDIIPRLSSTTDNTVPRHDGTTGLQQTSGVVIDDSNNVTGVVGLTLAGVLMADDSTSASAPVYTFDGDTNTGFFRPGADLLAAATGGSERVRVDASGNVGIGTTGPTALLHVSGSLRAGHAFCVNRSGSDYDGIGYNFYPTVTNGLYTHAVADKACRLELWDGGFLFKTAPSGSAGASVSFSDKMLLSEAGTIRLHAYGAGTLATDASGNVTASSDEALKEEIAPFTRGLDDILQISPISYNWNALSGLDRMSRYHGFSAQNVEAAIPEAVGVGPDGFLTLQDRPIVAALVNAVKELAGGVEFEYSGHTFRAGRGEKDSAALLITVAQTAVIQGAQAGNYRWFDADADFTIADAGGVPVQMDAVSAFAYCNALLRAII